MAWLQPTDPQLFFKKNDPADPRLGEWATRTISPEYPSEQELSQLASRADTETYHVLGYPDDEGITNGGGRPGAGTGPTAVRQSLYKMTPHLHAKTSRHICDWGNLNRDVELAERHQRGRKIIRALCEQKQKFITLGGGHDYGYADGAGFLDVYRDQAVVINFDAHLDVRPVAAKISSGTPFFRLLSEFKNQFKFIEFGLQPQCNSQTHMRWAQDQGADLFFMEDLRESFLASLQKSLAAFAGKKIFLSIDIDAFTSSEAPGCSQSWAGGLEFKNVQPALAWLYKNFDVCGLGIYEVSPPLDQDNRTSKLAAQLAHQFIFGSLT